MTDFVLYGGKGGVGKTTVATASALRSAQAGDDTLVVSTDPAHSLSDATETTIGGEPTELDERLWAVELDPQAGMDRYRALFEAIAADLDDAGIRMDEAEVADLFTSGVMPGSDELAALEGLSTYIEADRWDRVVFDTAPTGHTLRLLDLPAIMDRGLATALDFRSQVRRKVDTARTMMFGPLAAGGSEDGGEFVELRERMERVGDTLRDPERTAFRVVTIPEPMAVQETRRLVDQLREFDVPVSTLVVNKVIDEPGDCERCQAKRAVQTEAIEQLRSSLPDLDLWQVPDQSGAVGGLDALDRVGTYLGSGDESTG